MSTSNYLKKLEEIKKRAGTSGTSNSSNTSDSTNKEQGNSSQSALERIKSRANGTYKSPTTVSPQGKEGWGKYLADEETKKNAPKYDLNNDGKDAWWEKLLGYLGGGGGGVVDTTLPMSGTTQTIHDLRADDSYRRPNADWDEVQQSKFGELYLVSPERAYSFAEVTNKENNKKKEEAQIKEIQDSATSSFGAGAGHTVGAIATAPFGMADFLGDLAYTAAGREIAPDGIASPFEYSQAVTGGISEHLNEKGGTLDEDIPIIGGKGWGDVYGLGTSIAQSMSSAYTLGPIGTLVSYFGQGAASGVDDALARGASESQAVAYGAALGTFEGVAEMIGIDNLFKLGSTSTLKGLLKNVLNQAKAEGLEEGFTSVLSNIADAWILQDKSNFNIAIQDYMSTGMSETDAKWKVFWDSLEGIAFDTIAGAVSGSVSGGAHTTASTIHSNYETSVQHGGLSNKGAIEALVDTKNIKGVVDAYKAGKQNVTESAGYYVNEALEIDPNNAHAQRMQERINEGKNVSGYQINRLIEANESALVSQDKGKMKAAAEARLTELGETGDVGKIAEVIVKAQTGEKLTSAERKAISDSVYGEWVAEELNPDSANKGFGEENSNWAESIGTERINTEAYNRALQDYSEQAESAPVTENIPVKENAVESKISVPVGDAKNATTIMAKATMADTEGNTVEAKVAKIAEVEDGEATLELDGGQTVKASDVDFGDSGIGLVYNAATEMVSGVGGFNVDAANVMVRGFNPNGSLQSAATYVSGFNEAYRYGAMGYLVTALETGNATSKLSVEQREAAYNLGKAYGEGKVAEKQANIDSSKANKTGQKAKNGKVYFDGSTVGKSLTERQKASLKGLRVVAEATGVDIYVFESKEVNGKRQGANGWYDPIKKEIHLDLHAGIDGNGLMLFTASHELTHHIREVAPAKFKSFADALLEEYTKNGLSVDELIARKLETLEANGRLEGMTKEQAYDLAYEEVVADATESMLVDSNAIEALSRKIQAKDKGLWETIKDFIANLVNRIKAAYQGVDPDSREGKLVREMKDSAERLQKLWVDALLEASEVNTALGENGIIVNSKTDSASLMSVRDLLTDADRKKVSKALAERFGVTQAEAMDWLTAETSLASLILNPKYSQYLDYTADPNEEAIKSNSDYPQGTVDFSNICKKRRDFTEVMNRVLRNFPNHVFAATDLAKIRTIMEQEGMEVACAICYVEDRRQLDGPVAQDFIDSLALYRKGSKTRPDGKAFNANQLKALKLVEGDSYTPSIYELISLKGRNSLKAKNPAMEEAWVKFNNARGMQSVRLLLNDAEYKRQILKYSPSVVKRKNDYGGLRIYSFSDAEMFHLIDIIQVLTDSATVGLSVQGYTKVNEYAKAVKDTGEKLNRSLIPKGDLGYHMENGRVVLDFDTVEGIDINHPDFFDNIDNPNVGNIVIGINATQIKAAMTSKFIDQIIPFHTGQSGEVLGEKGIATWVNYKDFQSERDASTKKKSSHQINIYTEVINAAEAEGHPITNKVEFVNKFLQVCKENNLIPRFSDFLNVDENGDYVYTEGYHKFLVDFKTFDQNTGEYLPQMPVKPIFDNEYITKLLTDYVKSQQTKDAEFKKAMPKVLDRITKEIVNSEGVKYSDRDSIGNELSEEQQEYFKDSKVRDKKGNLMVLYHGTTANFNTFKKGDVGFHFGTKGAARGRVGFGKNVILKEVYLNITNPIVFDEDLGSWDADYRLTRELYDRGILTQAEAESVLLSDDKSYRRTTEAANKKLASLLVAKGYDGIAYSNTFETKKATTSYIVFNSNQAKEITNKTPTASADIRYSDRADTLDKSWGKSYNLYTATDDFIKEVTPNDRKAFSRSLANKTSGMADGEIRNIYIYSTEKIYVFRADGYMHGEMVNSFSTSDKQLLEDSNYEYDQIDQNTETTALWTEAVQSRKGRQRGDSLLSEGRGRSDIDDILSDNTSSSDSSRDTEREWTNPRTKEDYDEIVKKLREMLGMDTAKDSNSAKSKFSDRYSDEKLDKLLEELLSDLDWGDLTQFGGDSDISIDDISEELNVEPEKIEILIRRKGLGESHIEAGRTAVMKQARIDEAIEDSGASRPDYARKYITRISPKDFIDLTVSQDHIDRGEFDATVRGDHGSKMSDYDYKKALQDSRSPYLSVDRSTGRVIGHDGRHRIRALEIAGVESVEIEVQFFDEDGYLIKYDAETIPDIAISSQFDTAIETHLSTIIPLNEAHRAEIERTYGEKAHPDAGVRFQDRNPDSYSNRSLLAGALETAVQNDIEREKLRQYKEKIDLINSEEQKLHDLREQIKELSFKKGPRDTQAIKNLQFEANQAANRINTYDKQLLSLESTKALRGVLEREKALARKRDAQKYKEAIERYREKSAKTQRELMERYQESRRRGAENRNKTAMRHKIKDVVNELNQYLLRGTKDKHVPIELQKAVAEALDAVNMDTVGADERIAKKRAEMMSAKTPEAVERLAKEIETIQEMGGNMAKKISRLKTAYDSIINSDDPLVANSHDDVISSSIERVMEYVGETPLRDMSLPQLEAVYDMYNMVLFSIRNTNKAFKAKKSEEISVIANRVMEEVDKLGKKKAYSTKAGQTISEFDWNNQKPVYAFERIGSETFAEVFNNVRAGEDTWATDMTEAQEFREEQYKKHKYDSWDSKKRVGFTSTSGMHFELSLDQIMSLYAYSKREQAAEHLKRGGIVFDETTEVTVKNKLGIPVKFNPTEATAYNISEETLADIISKLTAEQKAFVDEMQDYLSTTMGEKGNEVSLELYGVKLFKEKHYFPLRSATQFMAKAKEQQKGEVKIKNSGFTKETVRKANNPIVLTPFMDVWAGHVNEMSMYHAFTLALEDFYRVYNYKTPTSDTMATESVEMFLQNAHGKGATKYIDQLLKDLNGGARVDSTVGIINKMTGLFKKSAVFASASVVIQQPSAIARATALVDTKYFVGKPSKHKEIWAEVKRYAPVAVIKEMGYFDTGMGKSSTEWLKGEKTWKDKVDDIAAKAPALADEYAWCAIWDAVKRETVHNNPSLKTSSEEFLKLVGERFTEVVTKTQVYDSVLSRSANMRSKDTGMKMATAFMGEPTTSLNMLQDALIQGKRGNKRYAAKAIGGVVSSMILNSILVSIVYAGRDDDEDKTYAEKYIGTLTEELLDSFNPLTLIPFAKDIVSIVQGYDVERSDMAVITDLINAWNNLDSDNRSVYRKVEDFGGAIASIFGLPVKNVMRDVRGMYNTINSFINGEKTTGAGIGNAIVEGITGKEKSNGQQLYEAMIKGDSAQIERIKVKFEDQKAIDTALRKALRENDPRIKEAAEARYNGNIAEYMKIAKAIIAEGNFKQDDVVAAINSEINALKKGEGETSSSTPSDKAVSLYSIGDYYAALMRGSSSTAYAVREDLIQTEIANGKDRDEAEASFNSKLTNHVRDMYEAGDIADYKAKEMLTYYAGKTEAEAASKVQYWNFKKKYPDYDLSEDAVNKYYSDVKPSGISVEVYYDYSKQRSKAKGVDLNGDGKTDSGSVKREVMQIINSLPISSYQKDVLYFINGWSQSTLWEAPWH